MKHQVVVYYAFCPNFFESKKIYRKHQRELEDKILSYDFINRFNIQFEKNNVGKGEYGKPYWKGKENIHFNVSNTDGLVVCACSDCEVGVDAEKAREIREPVLKRCCNSEEISYIFQERDTLYSALAGEEDSVQNRFLQIWTLKESYIKMTGKGMHFPLQDVTFSIERENEVQIKSSQPGYFVQERRGDYWISLCAEEEAEVVWREINF
ncbi:MAG: 4'-phosphopantetheinyl transferase superfamily protein [Lachnospiraceae bacterium]|nr:4'-phosphopantetheinyl transferase superfamily protein [Lachnospiraceae bacterium]